MFFSVLSYGITQLSGDCLSRISAQYGEYSNAAINMFSSAADCLQHCTSLSITTTLHTALHCSTPHSTAIHCTTPHSTAIHHTSLQYTTQHCNTPHSTAIHCTALQRTAISHNITQYPEIMGPI